MATATPSTTTADVSGGLALVLQEVFTATIRLRADRQVATDAASFRSRIKGLLAAADQEARRMGYDAEHVRLAVYALVAFLDESVLNSSSHVFADWPRQPLQEEVFGDHMAGETFFHHLRDLMGRQDSRDVADVLEVFDLCLLLGFHGRYGSETSELRALRSTVREKIDRIRGPRPLAPEGGFPPGEEPIRSRDPWVRRLGIVAVALLVLCVGLFAGYTWRLGQEVDAFRGEAVQTSSPGATP
ncbi:MAG: DotU family type IV/VI secretion system protein [Gemmatimonadota bacterium]|jgi:type VI secretion system protein ImpK